MQVTGSFVAKESSDVAPEAAGRVVETPVNVGDFVKQGQVIARLEDRDAQLRLEQAQAVRTAGRGGAAAGAVANRPGHRAEVRRQQRARSAFGESGLRFGAWRKPSWPKPTRSVTRI